MKGQTERWAPVIPRNEILDTCSHEDAHCLEANSQNPKRKKKNKASLRKKKSNQDVIFDYLQMINSQYPNDKHNMQII